MKAFITHATSANFPLAPDIAALIIDDKVLLCNLTTTTGGKCGYDWCLPGELSLLNLTMLQRSLQEANHSEYLNLVITAVREAIRGYGLQAIEEYEGSLEKK